MQSTCLKMIIMTYRRPQKQVYPWGSLIDPYLDVPVLWIVLPRLDADNQRRRKFAQSYLENITHHEASLPSLSRPEHSTGDSGNA